MISSLKAITIFAIVFAATGASSAHAQAADRLTRIVEAYGGAAALNRVGQVEIEWAGYVIGRYQSRRTDPPYDHLPIRSWLALDFAAGRSVIDSIGTYPGELNFGWRDVNDGARRWSFNTISRIYAAGSMHSHDDLVQMATSRMPWMLARTMAGNPGAFALAGTRERRGVTYDLIRHGESTLWVHPETSLIHAVSSRSGDLVDAETEVVTTYTDYFEHEGVMVNRGYQVSVDGEATRDLELYSLRFNHALDDHLRVPGGFLQVPTLDGYNGVAEVGVQRIGDGVFLAGSGDTRVLYVEFADHFVAMEAGGLPDYAEQAYNAMRPHMGSKPLRYIIPTHHHDDHAVAIHFYARVGATILTTRDKEGFMRRLLTRAWGDTPPVTNARFRFVDDPRLVLEDSSNRLEIHVYRDAPHTENMLVGYLGRDRTLYTCDVFVGWTGGVRQGASHGVRHLARWVAARQASGGLGPVRHHASCHGNGYSAAEFEQMLRTERTIATLPGNLALPSASWFDRYGLADDAARNPRRERVFDPTRAR
ncbi:MBL fold metallo-hydrolase [Sphingosinicella sp. LHD-64]|uniref:MBL fold metallo-hydrolase n=1 Tax=Sphingosinicella sp. LHD-64 TaxID=3072139 RepID=UPI00280CF9B9|nr:MBL fold metallo-hydrolase [Sphingosinicella sp. LHD-64]MDQ8754654.1 MBL fold metallo-hydrolase [Sphingosinicella sp. LHD-64]